VRALQETAISSEAPSKSRGEFLGNFPKYSEETPYGGSRIDLGRLQGPENKGLKHVRPIGCSRA
jgi:hypothetical protein